MMRGDRFSSGIALILKPERVEAALWRELRASGAVACREKLFNQYRALARSMARKHGQMIGATITTVQDLEQAAYQGLLQAIDRYDLDRGVPFAAYARARIGGSVRSVAVTLSEYGAQQDYRRRVERERLQSLQSGASPAGASEPGSALQQLTDLATELALSLMLDANANQRSGDTPGEPGNAFDSLDWRQTRTMLADEVDALPEPERSVVRQHYENDVMFAQIAIMLGLSKGRVSQLHKAALMRLRKRMKSRR